MLRLTIITMKQILSGLALLICIFSANAQKPVSGVFHYKATISLPDTNIVLKSWNVHLYTNDTIVRVETETGQFGVQVYIRHMQMNKAYLLLEADGEKYAIQTNLEKTPEKDTTAPEYTIKKKFGSKKIAGIKCRKYYIIDKGQTEGYYCWFAKKISNKYLEVYPEVKGLAVDYYLPSRDGLIHYELVSYTPSAPSRDLFGIPSDYKRISFDEFVRLFSGE
jgi:hypothetical protein